MSIQEVSCIAISCNVCGEPLKDEEDNSIPHFAAVADAVSFAEARSEWIVSVDGYAVCDTGDAEHQAALDGMLPPEPAPLIDGQVEIDYTAGEVAW